MKATGLAHIVYKLMALTLAGFLFILSLTFLYYHLNVKAIICGFAGAIEIVLSNQIPKFTSWLQAFAVLLLVIYIVGDVLVNIVNNLYQ